MDQWMAVTGGLIIADGVILAAWVVGAIAATAPRGRRRNLVIALGLILGAWFYIAFTRALGAPYPAFTFNALLGATIALAMVTLAVSPRWREAVAAVPLHWLIGMQVLRVIGGTFLIALDEGALSRNFAIPAAYGDVATGLLAIPVALAVAARVRGWRTIAWAFGIFGLADLIVAVGIGTGLLAPFSALIFGTSPVTAATSLGGFPISLIPTWLVPQAVILHLYAFWKLRRPASA